MYEWEKCIYCGSEKLKYNPQADEYVKCTYCGETIRTASFEREKLRIEEQIEARKKAEEDLRQAQQEKEEAQKQLGDAVSALAGIQSTQETGLQALTELLEGQADAKHGQQEITGFLKTLQQEGRHGQDALTRIMQSAIRSQKTNEDKLTALQSLSQDILAAQGRESAIREAYCSRLQTSQDEIETLIRQMSQWNRQTYQKNMQRLEAIVLASSALQKNVEKIDRKVDELQRKADETREAIDSFRGAWEQSKRDELVELYHRANNSKMDQRFDDAIQEYRDVLVKGGKDPEVYWRIVLCYYCVVYQKDDERRLIPTLINADLTEPDRITARLELEKCIAGTALADHYHRLLADIDRVLDRYRQVKDQMQYDVFISVKQSFENHGTTDSDMGSDLYDHLTSLGLRVFNSRRCKRDIPLGKDAEPYIISALLSSRVLIVVGTNHDFMNAQWVRNEWSRFQWLMKKEEQRMGKSQRELFCYLSRDMSPYDIPRGLNPSKQAICESGDAYEIIDKEMRRIFPHLQPAHPPQPMYEPRSAPALGGSKLPAMRANLLYSHFDTVLKMHEEGLASGSDDLTNMHFHLYALCAKYKVKNIEALKNVAVDLSQEDFYITACDFAKSPDDQTLLQSLICMPSDKDPEPPASIVPASQASVMSSSQAFAMPVREAQRDYRQDGVGVRRIDATIKAQQKKQDKAEELITKKAIRRQNAEGIKGLVFTITGILETFENQEHAKTYIRKLGGRVASGITANVDYLVTNNTDSEFEKNKRAANLGIEVISEADLNHLICRRFKDQPEIVIPSWVTEIQNGAFSHYNNLRSITIPRSVTNIGNGIFSWCRNLTSVMLPNSVNKIGDFAFYCCISLASFTVPNSVNNIGEMAFSRCSNLTKIIIPDSVTSIGKKAFELCNNLTILTPTGSYAENYAKENSIPYENI